MVKIHLLNNLPVWNVGWRILKMFEQFMVKDSYIFFSCVIAENHSCFFMILVTG